MTTYALTIALLLLAALPARAQDTPFGDARWAPWLGCWRLVQDDRLSLAATTGPEDVLVCVLPASGDRGVDLTTYVGGQSVVQQAIVADGTSHPVSEPECSGSQNSEWSLTGERLLTRAEIACSGQPTRAVSGIMLMTAGTTWVDIQAVGADQDAQIRVRRYERTSSTPEGVVLPADLQRHAVAATARLAGSTFMTLEEVVDASGKIAAPAVEAALLETSSRFNLNSRALKELDAAGVPDDVVDMMVALSFPGRIDVDRPLSGWTTGTQGETAASVQRSNELPSYSYAPYSSYPYYASSPYDPYYPYYPSYAYDPYYAYGAYSPYYFSYSPFGYSNWWSNPYGPYYNRDPRPYVVGPGDAARPGGSGGGRVIQGRGYTQGETAGVQEAPGTGRETVAGEEASPDDNAGSGTSSRRAVSRDGYSGSGSRANGGSSSSGGSSTGGGTRSSGSGSGSGGSGSRPGRTAQPR